ncbi:MAG: biotin transporter BioY [Alphaproteobacteria bacterium]|jgi:biotin transport system substrate-specific component|nr:biotin transporter BioY [Candidatus Jidaibacter sp.]
MVAIVQNSLVRISDSLALKTIIGSLLLFVMGQIAIPLEPVPITLHTVAVMLIGMTYDKKSAVSSVISYILIGAMGAPVFHDFTSGIAILTGTSAGYLFGFIPAVYFMSSLRERFRPSILRDIAAGTLGTIAIFICGISVLTLFVGFESAIIYGLLPFIISGAFKILMTASLLGIYRHYVR